MPAGARQRPLVTALLGEGRPAAVEQCVQVQQRLHEASGLAGWSLGVAALVERTRGGLATACQCHE
eukprot:2310164-Alexandrium_andersonii.AAC.1